jgi:hypothetical protein
MRQYTITASNAGTTETIKLKAYDDMNATMHGITEILDRAMKSDLWAKGSIELISPEGKVLQTMNEKE